MKTCVFAGTFDPITKGHEYVIEKCLEMFDKVVVAVGVNVDKKPMFSLSERMDIINSVYQDNNRIKVLSFDGMLTQFMKDNNIKYSVRGIRDEVDYKYETTMERYNNQMYPDMTTIYIPTPAQLTHVSSSGIRNIIELKAEYKMFLSDKAWLKTQNIIEQKNK